MYVVQEVAFTVSYTSAKKVLSHVYRSLIHIADGITRQADTSNTI